MILVVVLSELCFRSLYVLKLQQNSLHCILKKTEKEKKSVQAVVTHPVVLFVIRAFRILTG